MRKGKLIWASQNRIDRTYKERNKAPPNQVIFGSKPKRQNGSDKKPGGLEGT